jgi:hypothetical protein
MSDRQQPALERAVHEALRSLPPVRAPRTLESRVLEAIERRATAPWWRSSFARWPVAARIGFMVASLALLLMAILLTRAPAAESIVALPAHPLLLLPGVNQAQALLASLGVLRSAFSHAVPPSFLYAALAVSAALYALLVGLGAAAYRTLLMPGSLQAGYR